MPEIETTTMTFEVDEHLEEKLQQVQKDGWGIVPGIKPTTTYTLCRVKQDSVGGQAQLIIDEAGVMILPAEAHKKKKSH